MIAQLALTASEKEALIKQGAMAFPVKIAFDADATAARRKHADYMRSCRSPDSRNGPAPGSLEIVSRPTVASE